MFSDTNTAEFEVGGKTYCVARMSATDSIKVSKILISGDVMPFLQLEDQRGAVIMALMELKESDLKFVVDAALKKAKGENGIEVTPLTFVGDITPFWQLVAKVLFANFTELAGYLMVEHSKIAQKARQIREATENKIPRVETA